VTIKPLSKTLRREPAAGESGASFIDSILHLCRMSVDPRFLGSAAAASPLSWGSKRIPQTGLNIRIETSDRSSRGWMLVSVEEDASTPSARQFDESVVGRCQSVRGICSLIARQGAAPTRHPMSELGHQEKNATLQSLFRFASPEGDAISKHFWVGRSQERFA